LYQKSDFSIISKFIVGILPGVQKILVFGSYARGTAQDTSDLDIAILIEKPLERKKRLELLSELRWELALKGYKADIILKTDKEYESEKSIPTLASVIRKEGKVLWTKS
jgi:predicted nucleotidyltransferase